MNEMRNQQLSKWACKRMSGFLRKKWMRERKEIERKVNGWRKMRDKRWDIMSLAYISVGILDKPSFIQLSHFVSGQKIEEKFMICYRQSFWNDNIIYWRNLANTYSSMDLLVEMNTGFINWGQRPELRLSHRLLKRICMRSIAKTFTGLDFETRSGSHDLAEHSVQIFRNFQSFTGLENKTFFPTRTAKAAQSFWVSATSNFFQGVPSLIDANHEQIIALFASSTAKCTSSTKTLNVIQSNLRHQTSSCYEKQWMNKMLIKLGK